MPDLSVTQLLSKWCQGSPEALDRLMPLVYEELRKLASGYLRRERPGQTLDTGALVHEAFLRLIPQQQVNWQNRSHFFGIAARMMRRILVDKARERQYARRGRAAVHLSLDEASQVRAFDPPDVLEVDQALKDLEKRYPEEARVVELRFFGGLELEEVATVMGRSVPTIKRRWRLARAWLERYFAPPADDARVREGT